MGKWIVLQHVLTRELIHFSKLHRDIEPQINYYLILTDSLGIARLQAKKDNERRKELGVRMHFRTCQTGNLHFLL